MNGIETYEAPRRSLDNPLYYLDNFRQALGWLEERYEDLLAPDEREFIARFRRLPLASQALLVRMVMRTGGLFRSTRLRYAEIGCPHEAAVPLVELGWVDAAPPLSLDELFGVLNKSELTTIFSDAALDKAARKDDWLESLRVSHHDAKPLHAWHPGAGEERIYAVRVGELCDRLRLIYFGNLYQDWSEFVVADLGILTYERVPLSAASRGFQTRRDVDDYLRLHACAERLELEDDPGAVLEYVDAVIPASGWLRGRQQKLRFRIAQRLEQAGDLAASLDVYRTCAYPAARARAVRVLEKLERFEEAHALAVSAGQDPEDDAERQQLLRILPRLRRKLGLPKIAAPVAPPVPRIDLVLPFPEDGASVEYAVREHLSTEDAPAWYVENTLVNSLFGLLCWNAIFLPLPGAFFHPFQQGPADLHSADFVARRRSELDACLAQLDSGEYIDTIRRRYREKCGVQSPFVAWDFLDDELLEVALACLPPPHLRLWFERILSDIKTNRSGFPDLIQFWPRERRYRMVEVKGPGDRVQDNQQRFLEYCIANGMPVAVCYVQWQEHPA